LRVAQMKGLSNDEQDRVQAELDAVLDEAAE
jgi:hypothetical protein